MVKNTKKKSKWTHCRMLDKSEDESYESWTARKEGMIHNWKTEIRWMLFESMHDLFSAQSKPQNLKKCTWILYYNIDAKILLVDPTLGRKGEILDFFALIPTKKGISTYIIFLNSFLVTVDIISKFEFSNWPLGLQHYFRILFR